jgi:hypothetical protein
MITSPTLCARFFWKAQTSAAKNDRLTDTVRSIFLETINISARGPSSPNAIASPTSDTRFFLKHKRLRARTSAAKHDHPTDAVHSIFPKRMDISAGGPLSTNVITSPTLCARFFWKG